MRTSLSLKRLVVILQGRALVLAHDLNHVRVVAVESDLSPKDLILDRIKERRVPDHSYRMPLDEAHLKDALSEASLPCYLDDNALLACF